MPGTHVSHRSPVTRGRQLHCPLRGSQAASREPWAEQWQAGEGGGVGWACSGTPPAASPRPPARTLTGTGGEAVETRAALPAGGACVARAAATRPAYTAELIQRPLGVAVASCKRHRGRPWHRRWPPHTRLRAPAQSGPLLTSAVRVAMVAGATAVTVRAFELGPAQAVASLVAALGQGPRGTAATHCGAERGTGC